MDDQIRKYKRKENTKKLVLAILFFTSLIGMFFILGDEGTPGWFVAFGVLWLIVDSITGFGSI